MASESTMLISRPPTHDEFNASDADVIFQSSDGVQFHLHQKNLEVTTGAFPGAEFDTQDEIVYLTEPASVLEILFQYAYPRRHPDLEDQDVEAFFAIVEAVEKYEIFPAMNTCRMRLRHYTPDHPVDVLAHAIKHDHPKLIDEAAPLLIGFSLIKIFEKLHPTLLVPWLRFCEASRNQIFGAAKTRVNDLKTYSGCYPNDEEISEYCRAAVLTWITDMEKLESRTELEAALLNYENYGRLRYCDRCPKSHCLYTPEIAGLCQKGLEATPRFTTFLGGKKI